METPLSIASTAEKSYAETRPATPVPQLTPTIISSYLKRTWMAARLRIHDLSLLHKHITKTDSLLSLIKKARALRQTYYGTRSIRKLALVDGKYYWTHHCPGWPSEAYDRTMHNEIERLATYLQKPITPYIAFVAITKKCPLACEHCFEWDNLNKREKLSLADIKSMVKKLQENNVTQILFSGGEPMLRLLDMAEVIRTAKPFTDFWVFTSGYHFTAENALLLKQSGLTGVSISLDHYDEQAHNTFRQRTDAYAHALKAVEEAHKVGLVVSLALCATKAFVTEENLMEYARLAKKLGVAFIQLLEPRAVGHYTGKQVDLSPTQVELLTRFYEKMNLQGAYAHWPIVVFHGYHQRRAGCSGAGDRFFYVDTDGDMHACPFCQKKSGSLLTDSFDESVSCVKSQGCHVFSAPYP
jgi:MoaA/NifB/PqqE/SkfB family radical SAM enzyme